MIAFGDKEHAAARRRQVSSPDGVVFMKSEWMETGSDPGLSPTVFLIEQPPDTVAQTHFHRQNQFQLFIAGSGSIGHHAIRPLTVHYAGAYTGYGPLISGPQGLNYLTFRPVFDTGAYFIPEQRSEQRKGPKRGTHTRPTPIIDAPALEALREISSTTLLEPSAEGRAARTMNVPPRASVDIAGCGAAQGCFAVVAAGSANCLDRKLGLWDSVFLSADESHCVVTAGESGLALVLLYMPARDPAYA